MTSSPKINYFLLFCLFFSAAFFISIFSVHSQSASNTATKTNTISKLSEDDLKEIIDLIKKILKKIKQNQSLGYINKTTSTTSPSSTPQTPYYNPQTGQYQSQPTGNPSSSGGSPSGGSPLGGGASSPSSSPSGGSPSGGSPSGAAPSPAGGLGRDIRGDLEDPRGVSPGTSPVTIPANTPESCKRNYGFKITGGCSTKVLIGKIDGKIAKAGMEACTANGGNPVAATSIHRSEFCNRSVRGSPTSNHKYGNAIDVPPYPSILTQALERNGLRKTNKGNHWHYSATGR